MNPHKHVRLSPRGRALLVDRIPVQGLRIEEAAHVMTQHFLHRLGR